MQKWSPRNSLLFLLWTFNLCAKDAASYRILALFPMPSTSHNVVFQALTKELAARGHELVVLTSQPQKTPLPNYKDISVAFYYEEVMSAIDIEGLRNQHVLEIPFVMWNMGNDLCENLLSSPGVQELLHSNENFDLIIIEVFFNDCFLGFAHKFHAPMIAISSLPPPSWGLALIANPNMYSVSTNFFLPFTDRMTFTERLSNALFTFGVDTIRKLYFMPEQNRLAKKYFGDSLPPLEDIEKNTSLVIANAHFGIHGPRANLPNMIEVGGMHVKPPKKLPQDLQSFLDEAKDGVVYFSLGSNLKGNQLKEDKRKAFLEAFAEIPQRVLWKFESETLPGQPKNVKISKWLPQQDVLGHPNIRVFITHGGLLSLQEAAYNGVPLIGIPHFGDQRFNMRRVESIGLGVLLEYDDITKESLLRVLRTVIKDDPRYRENAERISKIVKDQPESPLDRAVFWTEYVIRHQGAPHLRSAAMDLTWYQYFLLDVIAFIALVVLAIIGTVYYLLRTICRLTLAGKKYKKE